MGPCATPAAATAWLKSIEPSGATTSTVDGVVVTQFAGSSSGETDAWAVDGSVVLAGSVDVVKAAVTSGPSNGLANEAGFKAAEAALGGDALGTVYVDVKDYVQVLAKSEAAALSQMGSQTGGAIPTWPR